jgi:hypothetical protein
MSMSVWLGGAYAVIFFTRKIHKNASIYIVFQYLAIICAFHCVFAVLIDNVDWLKHAVNRFFSIDVETLALEKNSRLYSFGVSYDTAGIRFSAVLLCISYLMRAPSVGIKLWVYMCLYIIIVVIGNMMSRTTIVGVTISLVYLIISSSRIALDIRKTTIKSFLGLLFCFVVVVQVCAYLYQTSPVFYNYARYGFEGFFNYVETGVWHTQSSDLLFDGLNFLPTSHKTWVIGDGYFDDPVNPGAFYMGVDMGYLRFVYYFGLIGLLIFILYFYWSTLVLCQRDPNRKSFYILLFILQLVVWLKIPTDIFCVFALLLLLTPVETDSQQLPNMLFI